MAMGSGPSKPSASGVGVVMWRTPTRSGGAAVRPVGRAAASLHGQPALGSVEPGCALLARQVGGDATDVGEPEQVDEVDGHAQRLAQPGLYRDDRQGMSANVEEVR